MSKNTEILTTHGTALEVEPAGSGFERVVIDPGLRDTNSNMLVPNAIEVSNGFHVASINPDGTFDVQNRLTVAADCLWTASFLHTIQDDPRLPDIIISAISPRAPLLFVGGGGGEVNDGANVGGFNEVYRDKTGVDLNFRTLQSSDGSVTITQNADDLDLTVVGGGGGEVNDGANVGGFNEVYRDKTGVDLNFRTLQSSDGSVTITQNADDLDLTVVGGGGADIRPNRITIGNAQNGDTLALCNYVWDNGDYASIQTIVDLIENSFAPPIESEFFFRQGTYTIPPSLCPIDLPAGKMVAGTGPESTIFLLGEDPFAEAFYRWDAFTLAARAGIRDFKILLQSNAIDVVSGISVVNCGANSLTRNVLVQTSGLPQGNLFNAGNLTAIFYVSGDSAEILDSIVDCDIQRTNLPAPITGVAALSNIGSDCLLRLLVRRCDNGARIGGFRNRISMQIANARTVGAFLGGSGNWLDVQARLYQTVADVNPAIDIRSSNHTITGNLQMAAILTAAKTGIIIGDAVANTDKCKISCSILGFSNGVQVRPFTCQDLHIENCHIVMDTAFPLAACVYLESSSTIQRVKILGNSLESDTMGVIIGDDNNQCVVANNTILGTLLATTGVFVGSGATQIAVADNAISVPGPGAIGVFLGGAAAPILFSVVSGNHIQIGDAGCRGIRANDCQYGTISGNSIRTAGASDAATRLILLDGGAFFSVSENNLSGEDGVGITTTSGFLVGTTKNTIVGNAVYLTLLGTVGVSVGPLGATAQVVSANAIVAAIPVSDLTGGATIVSNV
jgi:hypothetical protein